MKKLFYIIIFLLTMITIYSANITINTSNQRAPISPYIYGINQDLSGGENLTVKRLGGNRTTGYNWENNFSNAGEDWYNVSDNWLCGSCYGYPSAVCTSPGGLIRQFHQDNLNAGLTSIITVPMAGYVSADQAGTVTIAETAPSIRWKQVIPKKPGALVYPPDLSDNYVYVDEEVKHLVDTFGSASQINGVKFYDLDNEPGLWDDTHPRIHPNPPTCVEYVWRTTATAKAIKDVDPDAKTFGGVFFGWSDYFDLHSAPDWGTEGAGYKWFFDYYLDKMRQASQVDGRRLLDVLDFHYYSEARTVESNCYTRVTMPCVGNGTPTPQPTFDAVARIHAPRTLWETNYYETSWIGHWYKSYVPLIPEIINSINTYYPGTKISFTEWNFGGGTHISGGIAVADTLGIFAKYGVYLATYWNTDEGAYTSSGFKIYRNYDGANSMFGNTKIQADSDTSTMPVYASINDSDDTVLHIVIINKFNSQQPANVAITSPVTYTNIKVYGFDSVSANITERTAPTLTSNSFTFNMPAWSVMHFVLWITGTPTFTPTQTVTSTTNPLWTPTYTPTLTNTSTPVPPEFIENFEDGDTRIIEQQGRNGLWYDISDGTGTQTKGVVAGGYGGSNYAMHYYGSGFTDWGSGVGFNLIDPQGGPLQPYNASGYQGIKFWAKIESGSSNAIRIAFPNAQTHPDGGQCQTGCWDHFGIDLILTTTWQQYTIPFSSLTQQGWGDNYATFDITTLYDIEFRHNQNTSYNVWIDDIEFYGALTPTFTSTHTETFTDTITFTNTLTFTFTNTFTITDTPTDTFTFSSTPTGTFYTDTPTQTFTITITYTQTATETSSITQINTATNTNTFTVTPSHTPTATFSRTSTGTQVFTLTFTFTQTFTATPLSTLTPTATYETGEQELKFIYVAVYPNPVDKDSDLKIRFKTNKKIKSGVVRIYSIAFRLIFEFKKIKDFNLSGEIIINRKYFKNMVPGIYYYVVFGEDDKGKTGKSNAKVMILN